MLPLYKRPNITINSFGRYTQVFFITIICLEQPQKLRLPSGRYTHVWLYLETHLISAMVVALLIIKL